jgi:hypothetical protein
LPACPFSKVVQVELVETRPVLLLGMLRAHARYSTWFFDMGDEPFSLLMQFNRARGEIVETFRHDRADPRSVIINGVEITWRVRSTGAKRVIRDGKWVDQPPRTDGDQFGVVAIRREAVFARVVTVEPLELDETK